MASLRLCPLTVNFDKNLAWRLVSARGLFCALFAAMFPIMSVGCPESRHWLCLSTRQLFVSQLTNTFLSRPSPGAGTRGTAPALVELTPMLCRLLALTQQCRLKVMRIVSSVDPTHNSDQTWIVRIRSGVFFQERPWRRPKQDILMSMLRSMLIMCMPFYDLGAGVPFLSALPPQKRTAATLALFPPPVALYQSIDNSRSS